MRHLSKKDEPFTPFMAFPRPALALQMRELIPVAFPLHTGRLLLLSPGTSHASSESPENLNPKLLTQSPEALKPESREAKAPKAQSPKPRSFDAQASQRLAMDGFHAAAVASQDRDDLLLKGSTGV